jgi:hypothetical protein
MNESIQHISSYFRPGFLGFYGRKWDGVGVGEYISVY